MSCSTCSCAKKGGDFDLPEQISAGKRSVGDYDIHIDREYTVRHEEMPLERI